MAASNAANHSSDSISGSLRPYRSATQPETSPPASRTSKVSVIEPPTAAMPTLKSAAMYFITSKKIVKSKASSTQPDQAAKKEAHWARVGCFHHGVVIMPIPLTQPRPALQQQFVHRNRKSLTGRAAVLRVAAQRRHEK